jgi:histone H3/H4
MVKHTPALNYVERFLEEFNAKADMGVNTDQDANWFVRRVVDFGKMAAKNKDDHEAYSMLLHAVNRLSRDLDKKVVRTVYSKLKPYSEEAKQLNYHDVFEYGSKNQLFKQYKFGLHKIETGSYQSSLKTTGRGDINKNVKSIYNGLLSTARQSVMQAAQNYDALPADVKRQLERKNFKKLIRRLKEWLSKSKRGRELHSRKGDVAPVSQLLDSEINSATLPKVLHEEKKQTDVLITKLKKKEKALKKKLSEPNTPNATKKKEDLSLVRNALSKAKRAKAKGISSGSSYTNRFNKAVLNSARSGLYIPKRTFRRILRDYAIGHNVKMTLGAKVMFQSALEGACVYMMEDVARCTTHRYAVTANDKDIRLVMRIGAHRNMPYALFSTGVSEIRDSDDLTKESQRVQDLQEELAPSSKQRRAKNFLKRIGVGGKQLKRLKKRDTSALDALVEQSDVAAAELANEQAQMEMEADAMIADPNE